MKHIHICSIVELRHLLGKHQIPPKSYALISSNSELDIPVPIPFSFECYDDIDLHCLGRVFSVEAANRFAKAIKKKRQYSALLVRMCQRGPEEYSCSCKHTPFLGLPPRRAVSYLERPTKRTKYLGLPTYVQSFGRSS